MMLATEWMGDDFANCYFDIYAYRFGFLEVSTDGSGAHWKFAHTIAYFGPWEYRVPVSAKACWSILALVLLLVWVAAFKSAIRITRKYLTRPGRS